MIPTLIRGRWYVSDANGLLAAEVYSGTAMSWTHHSGANDWARKYHSGELTPAVGASAGDAWQNYETIDSLLHRLDLQKYAGLPSVGAGRPGSMFGGLKSDHKRRALADGYGAATTAAAQPSYGISAVALLLAFRAGMDGLGIDDNEEALLAGVPVVAFQ